MITVEQIAQLLTKKFSGTRKDVLLSMAGVIALQVETEDDAQTIVDSMTADKVQAFSKSYRSTIDAEVQQSNKTLEDNLRKKYDFKEKQDPKPADPPTPQPKPGELTIDAIKAILSEQMKPFQQRLDAIDAAKATQVRKETYLSKLREANLGQATIGALTAQFDAMHFATDDDFQAFLTNSQPTIDALKQEAANASLRSAGPVPAFGSNTANADADVPQAVIDHIASRKTDPAKSLGGKAI